MNAKELLKQKKIDPNKPILQITREDALSGIMNAMEEFCPSVKIEEMPKKDLEKLVDSSGEDVVNYHPEDYHQERSTLLGCIAELKKCGLNSEDEDRLDFC